MVPGDRSQPPLSCCVWQGHGSPSTRRLVTRSWDLRGIQVTVLKLMIFNNYWPLTTFTCLSGCYVRSKKNKKRRLTNRRTQKKHQKKTCSLPKILGMPLNFFGGLGKSSPPTFPKTTVRNASTPTESTTIPTCPSMSAWSASCRPMLWVVNSRKSALPIKKKTITWAGGWASETSHKSGYNPCKWWPYQGLNGVITLLIGVL